MPISNCLNGDRSANPVCNTKVLGLPLSFEIICWGADLNGVLATKHCSSRLNSKSGFSINFMQTLDIRICLFNIIFLDDKAGWDIFPQLLYFTVYFTPKLAF